MRRRTRPALPPSTSLSAGTGSAGVPRQLAEGGTSNGHGRAEQRPRRRLAHRTPLEAFLTEMLPANCGIMTKENGQVLRLRLKLSVYKRLPSIR